jgi:putative thiamine transport system permease protein
MVVAVLEDEARRPAGRWRLPQGLVFLPLIMPQVTFLFGLQVLFITLRIDSGFAAVAFAHLIFVLPYVALSLADPWRAFDRRYALAAAGLGATPNRVLWQVRLPMLTRAVATAAAVGFAVSIGQYLATLLIGGGRTPTVTTEAVALAAGGNRRIIGVYAMLQMVLPLAGFLIAQAIPAWRFRHRRALRLAR